MARGASRQDDGRPTAIRGKSAGRSGLDDAIIGLAFGRFAVELYFCGLILVAWHDMDIAMSRILFLTNSDVSEPLIGWLRERCSLIRWDKEVTYPLIDDLKPDIIVSYSYRHIVPAGVLVVRPGRFINLHISLLPYNRGADPNVWSFLEDTPKGITIHTMAPEVDTGAILLQREMEFDESRETLGSSYHALQMAIQKLFVDNWEALRDRAINPVEQQGVGTYHKASEFAAIRDQLLGAQGWDVLITVFKQRYRQLKVLHHD